MAMSPSFVLACTLCLFSFTSASAVSPMEKVIAMIEGLQTKVLLEGKMEAQTYDVFACFCKDTSAEKSDAITGGEDAVDALEASIATLTSERADLDDDIAEYQEDIARIVKELKAEKKRRDEKHATYKSVNAELTAGHTDIGSAMGMLKSATKGASMLQLESVLETLKAPIAMAEALGFARFESKSFRGKRAMIELLQQGHKKMHMTELLQSTPDIVQTLEGLETDFGSKIQAVDAEEKHLRHEYDMFKENKLFDKGAQEKKLNEANELKSSAVQQLGKDVRSLTEASGTLTDDKAYISELTNACNRKAAEWAQRSEMRAAEITALGDALNVLKEKSVPDGPAFTQRKTVASRVTAPTGASDEDVVEDIAEADESPAFLQFESPRHRLAAFRKQVSQHAKPSTGTDDRSKAQLVANLLKERGLSLKSQVLLRLAAQANSDPLAKVKSLVQELIERLLQEAADEANLKGWCDKEIGKAKQARQHKTDSIKKLNEAMAGNEAKRDKLNENIVTLQAETQELTESLSKLEKERNAESAENEVTLQEAQEGLDAVKFATKILSEFYGTAAKASFVQTGSAAHGVEDDIPDAGFEGSYKGAQAGTGGIMGMLEVIVSDYNRVISVTTKAEGKAAKEFLELETQTKISTGTKTVAVEAYQAELIEVNSSLQEDKISLEEEQALLDKTIQEIDDLRPQCIDTGMSYEEKIAKREQETESLKEALSILEESA